MSYFFLFTLRLIKINLSSKSDFYAHLVDGVTISKSLVSSTKLLTSKKVPTVIHFYDGG
jgi:hypothetical protein